MAAASDFAFVAEIFATARLEFVQRVTGVLNQHLLHSSFKLLGHGQAVLRGRVACPVHLTRSVPVLFLVFMLFCICSARWKSAK